MKKLSILTVMLVLVLGLSSCGKDDDAVITGSNYNNSLYSGQDNLNLNQYQYVEQRYDALKVAMQNKSITQGLKAYDYFQHSSREYSTNYWGQGTVEAVKKAVDSVGTASVSYTEFTGSPAIDPQSATSKVFDSTDKQVIIDTVFSRSHIKVLQSVTVTSVQVAGRSYVAYRITYLEQNPVANWYYQNKQSSYVICLDIPLMANPILADTQAAGEDKVELTAAYFTQPI